MATTYEKMHALAAELREQAIADTSDEMDGLVAVVQLAAAAGIDVFEWIIPDDPAEADVFIDQLLALFWRCRGDDLPPFDPDLYGEALVALEPADEPEAIEPEPDVAEQARRGHIDAQDPRRCPNCGRVDDASSRHPDALCTPCATGPEPRPAG